MTVVVIRWFKTKAALIAFARRRDKAGKWTNHGESPKGFYAVYENTRLGGNTNGK